MWKGCEVLDPENCDIMVQGLVDSLPTGPPSGVQLQTYLPNSEELHQVQKD